MPSPLIPTDDNISETSDVQNNNIEKMKNAIKANLFSMQPKPQIQQVTPNNQLSTPLETSPESTNPSSKIEAKTPETLTNSSSNEDFAKKESPPESTPLTPNDGNILEISELSEKLKKLYATGKPLNLQEIVKPEYYIPDQPGVTKRPLEKSSAPTDLSTLEAPEIIHNMRNIHAKYFAVTEEPLEKPSSPTNLSGEIEKKTHETLTNLSGNKDSAKKESKNALVIENLITAITSYKKQRNELTAEYYHQWLPHFFQKSRTSKLDSTEMLLEALTALKEGKSASNIDLQKYQDVIRNGELGRTLRTPIKEGKLDALFGKKITTVSEFIKELEDSVKAQNSPKKIV